ncbi:MAG: hypothetical protein KatS3mg076_0053 [Candidatus Binatia bacterium]|nr:MAG: hypothetical protein KatS3mg076_0053 [Candidatus Binatia bacterium]
MLVLASVVLAASLGPVPVDFVHAVLGPATDNLDRTIVFRARLPRILLGLVVGGALASSGAALQAILRNPLAEPHILGVSGGAALGGVVTVLFAGATPGAEWSLQPLGAFAGALAATLLVYRLGIVRGRLHPYTLLLAGVVCNALAGALLLFLNAIADVYQAQSLLFWLMGSLAVQSYGIVAAVAVYVALGFTVLLREAPALNCLSLGDDEAFHLGVDVHRVRRSAFVASAFLVGAVVSVSGMIGFVGLVVPHIVRILTGADNRLLIPASFLAGGVTLLWADTGARVLLGATELPVGVVTALLGGPFFVYLLRRESTRT